jgi:hypothetical protein
MLVVLNILMDQKWGLAEEERKQFRELYGDPWFMVQQLLGHASRGTTVRHYLNSRELHLAGELCPVSRLSLAS